MNPNPAAHIEIIGVNGQSWTVSGPGAGEQGVLLDDDPEGLFDEAPWTAIWEQGATQQGATLIGVSEDPIDLVLGFTIYGDPHKDMAWDYVEAQFYNSFHKQKEATIQVTTKVGTRRLRVVKLEQAKLISAKDPHLVGFATVQLTLRAGWPFWEGESITSTFRSHGHGEGHVIVENPGDVPLWPKWVATAPGRWTIPDFDFEGGRRTITTPHLSTGQDLTIDTYPRRESYVAANGSNIAGRFGGVEFLHPIPPGTPPTALPVKLVDGGAGSAIQCRMVHHWQRPIGKGTL